MTNWTPTSSSSVDSTRIPEDILSADGGVLRKRGRLLYQYDADSGFPMIRQHYAATGQSRPALTVGAYPSGLLIGGIGQEADGYGERHNGGAAYMNLDRVQEACTYTLSGRFGLFGEDAAGPSSIDIYVDTQGWDDGRRNYFRVRLYIQERRITIRSNSNTEIDVAPAGTARLPGFNENKFDDTYFSFSYYLERTGVVAPGAFGAYQAFQIGGVVYDLRNLAGGWANWAPQVGAAVDSFAGGRNPGFGVSTSVAGKTGGIVLTRLEETIGDTLA